MRPVYVSGVGLHPFGRFPDRSVTALGVDAVRHALTEAGVARGGKDGVRILGKGEFKTKLSFKVAGVSKGAREAIEKAGGSVEVIEVVPAAEKAAAKKNSVKKRAKEG